MPETPLTNWEEAVLTRLADGFSYPITPDVAGSVRARLAERALPVAPRRLAWAPALAAAVGVALLVAAVVLTASSGVREAVAGFLGLAVEGEEIHLLPTPVPGVTPTPFPTPRPLESYATPVALRAVAAKLGFEPAIPTAYGSPKGSYIVDYQGTTVLVLEYDRFDLWETRVGAFEKGIFTKETQVLEQLTVNGKPAYWISPGSHIVRFIGADGKEVVGSERTVTRNTLVWRAASGTNYRLETDLSRDEAVRLAEGLP